MFLQLPVPVSIGVYQTSRAFELFLTRCLGLGFTQREVSASVLLFMVVAVVGSSYDALILGTLALAVSYTDLP